MSETNEVFKPNEILKEKQTMWVKLDQANTDQVNSQLGNSGLKCVDDCICLRNFETDTVSALLGMLKDVSAGRQLIENVKYPLNMQIQAGAANQDHYIIYACKPAEKQEFFEKLNIDINITNERLDNVGSPIRLPKHL